MKQRDFGKFFLGLGDFEQTAFAEDAGTTVRYIKYKLIGGQRLPQPDLLRALSFACHRQKFYVDAAGLWAYFLQKCDQRKRREAKKKTRGDVATSAEV